MKTICSNRQLRLVAYPNELFGLNFVIEYLFVYVYRESSCKRWYAVQVIIHSTQLSGQENMDRAVAAYKRRLAEFGDLTIDAYYLAGYSPCDRLMYLSDMTRMDMRLTRRIKETG